MALITLASAHGSPGVTSTALGLALNWSRPAILVEADPSGASAIAAGWFRGEQAFPSSLLDLVMANRRGALAEALPATLIPLRDDVSFIPGIRSHTQAASLTTLWDNLAGSLASLDRHGMDVIVDAGRLGHPGTSWPLIRNADLTLLATRSHLPGLAAARNWSTQLQEEFADRGSSNRLGLAVIGPGHPYSTQEASKTLRLPVDAELAWDPVSAEVYSRGSSPSKRFATSTLNKSLRAAVSRIGTRITETRSEIAPGETADV